MHLQVKGTYSSWQDSLLSVKIVTPALRSQLDKIWEKASQIFPHTTWEGWVDHSAAHILNVLRNLDRLIPEYVFNDIMEQEAFVLISATLLHDIGMLPKQEETANKDVLSALRKEHGERAVEIIKRDFRDHLAPPDIFLSPVCEIVKNHQGPFLPAQIVGLPYDIRSDALWVRMADELDFGPHRGPAWLMDHLQPNKDHLKHWNLHNHLEEPSIDMNLFRIQIRGKVDNDLFIRKLRDEIEAPERQDLQKIFLNRGLSKYESNRTFLIWDMTTVPELTTKGVEARPSTFTNDQFFAGARFMYNLGHYEAAVQFFEEGVKRTSRTWTDKTALPFFYHYIKSLHALGKHEKAINLAENILESDNDIPVEIRAAIEVANGLGNWKLSQFHTASVNLNSASTIYNQLAKEDIKHKIDEADACVLLGMVNLERARKEKDLTQAKRCENWISRADRLYKEYESDKPKELETHYKGRYWGFKAFYMLTQVEANPGPKLPSMWTDIIDLAIRAHGGEDLVNRNPFGAMCGKYCVAAIHYHKSLYCDDKTERLQALLSAARIIREVYDVYSHMFNPGMRIFRTWAKIHALQAGIYNALPEESKSIMGEFDVHADAAESQEIFTPLH